MFDCLYCGHSKQQKDSSLEHAVPQFLGGSVAPARFHLKNVCAQCNNRLGLFVDASYAKAWFTTNALAQAARLLCAAENDPGLPLSYMGHAKISGLVVPTDYVAEHWLGPFGETIIWIRLHDERMDTYAGGNPIDARRAPSTIYFVPTASDSARLSIALKSLERMVEKKKARKILCAQVLDASGAQVESSAAGFNLPDAMEAEAAAAILQQISTGTMRARAGVNAQFDHRFICKMALGVGFSLFGQEFLALPASSALRSGVWPAQGTPKPAIHGSSTLAPANKMIAGLMHYPGAVVLVVMCDGDRWCLTLMVDPQLTFTVEIGPACMTGIQISQEEGYALVLIPYLEQSVELTVAALIAHRTGDLPHPELVSLDQRKSEAKTFWALLNP